MAHVTLGEDRTRGHPGAGRDRAGRERLLRYCARPPFALERLRDVDPEHLFYESTKPGPGGTGSAPGSVCPAGWLVYPPSGR